MAKAKQTPAPQGDFQPFTREEADKIMESIDKFFIRLGKKYGAERFDNYSAVVVGMVHPDGLLTNLRGNMHVSQFAMANALTVLVDGVARSLQLPREAVLLSSIYELAKEVRKLWEHDATVVVPSPTGDAKST